jgi:adenylyltransferase/sulfurtransferase
MMEKPIDHKRYSRHLALQGFGKKGQSALLKARVLVIGAGGLSCPLLQYLCASGVGCIGIVDYDTVDLTNLHRQTLYGTADVGFPKVQAAAERLRYMNPELEIVTYHTQLNQTNALSILSDFDVVVDGSDNYATRYLVNDACVILNKVLVYGAVLRYEGQVAVFNYADKQGLKTNYRDVFPNEQAHMEGFACSDVGVLGVLPGIIGNLQAAEVIKIICGVGEVLANKILHYNLLNQSFYDMQISPLKQKPQNVPHDRDSFLQHNYGLASVEPK